MTSRPWKNGWFTRIREQGSFWNGLQVACNSQFLFCKLESIPVICSGLESELFLCSSPCKGEKMEGGMCGNVDPFFFFLFLSCSINNTIVFCNLMLLLEKKKWDQR